MQMSRTDFIVRMRNCRYFASHLFGVARSQLSLGPARGALFLALGSLLIARPIVSFALESNEVLSVTVAPPFAYTGSSFVFESAVRISSLDKEPDEMRVELYSDVLLQEKLFTEDSDFVVGSSIDVMLASVAVPVPQPPPGFVDPVYVLYARVSTVTMFLGFIPQVDPLALIQLHVRPSNNSLFWSKY